MDRDKRLHAPSRLRTIQSAVLIIDARMAARQRVPVAEYANAAVKQETANDRLDADIFRQARNARTQAANTAYHARIFTPACDAR